MPDGDDNEDRHEVTLTHGFELQITPVTQSLWDKTIPIVGVVRHSWISARRRSPPACLFWSPQQLFLVAVEGFKQGSGSDLQNIGELPAVDPWEAGKLPFPAVAG